MSLDQIWELETFLDEQTVDRPRGSSGERYTNGYIGPVVDLLGKRSADWNARFFLPYLSSGMSVLDCGCGPGAITLGLARAVAPGHAVGIDIEPTQIEAARLLAAQTGVANTRFEVANVYDLPFPDASFDAAFAHTSLQHVQDQARAIREMKRVLKPGGVIGLRDDDWGTTIWEPSSVGLRDAESLFVKVWQHNGGDPMFGRKHRRFLREAGFERCEAWMNLSSSHGSATGPPAEMRSLAEVFASHNSESAFVQVVLDEKWADQEMIDESNAALREWGKSEDAVFGLLWCETVGWVPTVES